MRIALAALMMMAATAGETPNARRLLPRPRRRPPLELGPRKVPCRSCGAAVGESCDRRTLGRYRYHRVRVDDSGGEA